MRANRGVRRFLYGFGKFTAMTTVFCTASIIAITGPPTESELAALRAAFDRTMREVEPRLARAGETACAQWQDHDIVPGACDGSREEVEPPARTATPLAPAPQTEPSVIVADAPLPREDLLGAGSPTPRVRAASVREQSRAERREARRETRRQVRRPAAARPRLAAPPPLGASTSGSLDDRRASELDPIDAEIEAPPEETYEEAYDPDDDRYGDNRYDDRYGDDRYDDRYDEPREDEYEEEEPYGGWEDTR